MPGLLEKLNKKMKTRTRSPRCPLVSPIEDPLEEMAKIRGEISRLQYRAKSRADGAFFVIAVLFVSDIICLELFTKFPPPNPWVLLIYLIFFCATLAVILVASWLRWQPIAEDYRALNEILRVQRAWWAAGLGDRVDRCHLQSDDSAGIRDSAAAIINGIWLRSGWTTATPPRPNWPIVRASGTDPRPARSLLAQPDDWIGSQIWYFSTHYASCRRAVSTFSALTWSLFAASGWLAALLLVWLAWKRLQTPFVKLVFPLLPSAEGALTWNAILPILMLLPIGMLALWSVAAVHIERLSSSRAISREIKFVSAGIGAVIALTLAIDLQAIAILLTRSGNLPAILTAYENVTVLVFVVLSAIAGAFQYVMDKWNLEPESLEYRDTLALFERAERFLARDAAPGHGGPRDTHAARQLVVDLARLALRENEAWLKARRERPLSPVIG